MTTIKKGSVVRHKRTGEVMVVSKVETLLGKQVALFALDRTVTGTQAFTTVAIDLLEPTQQEKRKQ